jgi:hypothetical protein
MECNTTVNHDPMQLEVVVEQKRCKWKFPKHFCEACNMQYNATVYRIRLLRKIKCIEEQK